MSNVEMQTRVAPMHNCDQVARGNAIKRGKSSLLSMQINTNIIQFWTYEDVYEITNYTYEQIKYFIKKKNGIGRNDEFFKYIKKYNNKNEIQRNNSNRITKFR